MQLFLRKTRRKVPNNSFDFPNEDFLRLSIFSLELTKSKSSKHQHQQVLQSMQFKNLALASSSMISQSNIMAKSSSFVTQARQLKMPSREEILRRDPSVYDFWLRYDNLLQKAWKEWSEEEGASLPILDSSLYHPDLRKAIEESWKDPGKEDTVKDLWTEVAPGVFQCQFFDPKKIGEIRAYLDKAGEAGIPARPPYGIVLNRKGFMIDQRSVGYLAIPQFQKFYRELIDTYMRPLGRLFFPEYIQASEDSESFAFSIQYQAGGDQSIRQHTDASSLTLNINLNIPDGGEDWSGSSLYFVEPETGKRNYVDFAPGVAIMHRGMTAHAALPITSGERSNLVLWLYGKDQRMRYTPYGPDDRMTPQERWTKPPTDPLCDRDPSDAFNPF